MTLKQAYTLCFMAFIALCFLLPIPGRYDTSFWVDWSRGMQTTGLAHVYKIADVNYNPLYLYVLRIYASLVGNNIEQNIIYLKILPLIFDFGAIVFLIKWLYKHKVNFFASFFILFNIAYLYNTLCWGQIDAIHTTLVFIAFVSAIEGSLLASILFFILAFNVKTQAILFIPPLALLWLPLLRTAHIKGVAKILGSVVVMQLLILLPFILKGTVGAVWHNLIGVVDYNTYLSMRAYNFWFITTWTQNHEIPRHIIDTDTYFGIACKTWGLVLFFIFSAAALLPLALKALVFYLKQKQFSFAQAAEGFLALTLVSILFFYFPTQMHERYSHPAILFAGVYAVLTKRWLIFVLVSYAYLMNMEAVERYWNLTNYKTFIFDPRFIACLYTLALLIGFVQLYKYYNLKSNWLELKEMLVNKRGAIQ